MSQSSDKSRFRRVRLIVHIVVVVGLLSLLLPTAAAPPTAHAASFSNPTSITIPSSGTASPYPSTISVSELTGVVSKVTVTLRNFTHTFPDDVDILLVGPTGANAIIMADAGGAPLTGVSNLTITLDDAAGSPLPDGPGLTTGAFRPANHSDLGDTDSFPAPAPTTTGESALLAFNLSNPNGEWQLFVVDDSGNDAGSIAGGWSLDITTAPAPRLMISEFRPQGPGGSADEYVEIYNGSDVPHVVTPTSGTGYSVISRPNVTTICTIPTGTTIPARGHFLCVRPSQYSLGSYPAGNGSTANGDADAVASIPLNTGVALFNHNSLTGGGAIYTSAFRLDAVGSTDEANNAIYREGNGYPALPNSTSQLSIFRVRDADGHPQDTNNNAANFLVVDTAGTNFGNGVQWLGAPGPESLSSPIFASAAIGVSPLDPCVSSLASPNQVRDTTAGGANDTAFGTLDVRRTITNTTGQNITRLRFRVIELSTFPSPSGTAGSTSINRGHATRVA